MVKKTLTSGFLFLAFLLSAKGVFAAPAVSILSYPSQTQTETSFTIDGKIQADPKTSFYLKIRVGSSTSSLTKGLTYNSGNSVPNDWLSDTDAWTNFPLVTTDSNGNWQGQVTGKISSTANLGANFLVLRTRKTTTTTPYDSDTAQINVLPNTPTPTPSSGNIILSEFMPNPSSGNEWAEVYNPNSSEINIDGWKIDDGEGGSSPFSIPAGTKIGAKAYTVFSFSAKLNNSGDTIRLLNPSGTAVESYSFGETTKSVAFAKDSAGHWQQTSTPTPSAANKITAIGNSTKPQTAKSNNEGGASSQTNSTDLANSGVAASGLNTSTATASSGKVAGISEKSSDNKKLSILLIAAGLSCLITAFAWPVVEKMVWTK